jgi:UV DNA damage endonuclease
MYTNSMTQKRIGFACKFMYHNQTVKKRLLEDFQRPLNTRATTVAWLNRQKQDVAEQQLWDIMVHNIQSYYNLIKYVGTLPKELHMLRLGSDVLPMYTEPSWRYFWQRNDVKSYCEREFARVGNLARELDVRLSMHPGQFCCLASESDDVVERSIEEFEYHVDVIRYMGYGQQFQDFKCNVHVSGRRGVEGIKQSLKRLSHEALNTITFENDEYSAGLNDILELADHTALVFDNHHHFIHSNGEHLTPSDDRYKRLLDSWRGVRPAMHYSVSREEYLTNTDANTLPSMTALLDEGHKKGKLRAHSDYYTNNALNDLMYEFWQYTDLMCESKMKNLASIKLHKYFTEKSNELS